MAKHSRSVCGVDLRKDCICMAQYFPHDSSVASIIIKPLSLSADAGWDAIRAEFVDLIAEIRFTDQDVVCALPGESTLIKNVTLDSSEDDIRSVIEWEASQQIVGSIEDYVIDYEPLRADASKPGQRFFVVGARLESVDQMNAIMRAAKLNTIIVDVDIFALVNLFEANYPEFSNEACVIVSATAESIAVFITISGKLIDYEYRGVTPEIADGAGVQALVLDCLATLQTAMPHNIDVPKIFLTGPLLIQEDLAAYLCSVLPNSQMLDPFRTIACRAEMSPEDLKKHAPQLAIAVGLAVRGGTEVDE